MTGETRDPIILNPGPVTTTRTTREALVRDFSLNEPDFLALTAEIRQRLVDIAGGDDRHTSVLLQGSGNFTNEAVLGSLVPADRTLLIINNGFYGERLVEIARHVGLEFKVLEGPWDQPADPSELDRHLDACPETSHLIVCQVDTGTGLLNPVADLAAVAKRHGVRVIVDAVASFGGLPLDVRALDLEAVVTTPNKWLEGVPGMGAVVAKRAALEAAEGRCHAYCLDLFRQWRSFETTGRWRFTPPTQATAAFASALRAHAAEGLEARRERITANWRTLVEGLRGLGLKTVLDDEVAAPVIATFHSPDDPAFDPEAFFRHVGKRGFVMFRGCLTPYPTFRIGCMGAIGPDDMAGLVDAIKDALDAMGVRDRRPQSATCKAAG